MVKVHHPKFSEKKHLNCLREVRMVNKGLMGGRALHFRGVVSWTRPLRVNPLFTFNYTANYDGVNGWYYQIGVI